LECYSKKRKLIKENERYLHENEMLKQKLESTGKEVNNIIQVHKKLFKTADDENVPAQKKRKTRTAETEGSVDTDFKSEENVRLTEYVEELEKLIKTNSECLSEKNEEIEQLRTEMKNSEGGQLRQEQQQELQAELNFYS
jgi:hypothetical protein